MQCLMKLILVTVLVIYTMALANGEPGAVYTRWGRTTCGSNSLFVYAGHAAGSHYTEKGGSSTYICLPGDPTFRSNSPSEGSRANIWGAEYAYFPNTDGLALHNWDVPCAVCQSAQNGVFMLPGRDECYDGWITEYTGWLAAQHITYYRTEFVCMDEHGERSGSANDENGALFSRVLTKCGSLPCDVYPTDKDLKCVVCSR